ncbi:hypothetical protein Q670_14970 [Alcanivorax sp. P2S70]|nr:hypothetical protein Q670_14970 [Alcanivorax sp. P2S70]
MDILPFYGERSWLKLECEICPNPRSQGISFGKWKI